MGSHWGDCLVYVRLKTCNILGTRLHYVYSPRYLSAFQHIDDIANISLRSYFLTHKPTVSASIAIRIASLVLKLIIGRQAALFGD